MTSRRRFAHAAFAGINAASAALNLYNLTAPMPRFMVFGSVIAFVACVFCAYVNGAIALRE